MKKFSLKVSFWFLLGSLFFVSCQDSIKEYLVLDSAQTRSVREEGDVVDYYWFKGERIPITRVTNKSYVLFNADDENAIVSAFAKESIRINQSKIKRYNYNGTDLAGNAAKSFINHKWVDVDINATDANEIKEVVYAAPYYCSSDGDSFPLTNLIYVHLKDDADLPVLENIAKESNVGIIGKFEGIPHLYLASCTKASKGNALEMANNFYESGLFEDVQPAFMSARLDTPNDSLYTQQWNLDNTGQFGSNYSGIDINYSQSYGTCSSNIIVGVVDEGVELTHSDLNIYSQSWDASTYFSPSYVYGPHGTKVAGVIGAKTNNSKGIAGIASGSKIMSLSNDFSNSATIEAQLAWSIIKAADNGASVINNSWSFGINNTAFDNAITYAVNYGRNGKGCVLAFSAGNLGGSSLRYPAKHTPEKEVIAVGAISYDGNRKTPSSPDGGNWGSNYGTNLDIVAPGVKIPTTTTNNSYVTNFNGNSSTTPQVSAVAALILSTNPNLYFDEVGFIIQSTANKTFSSYTFNSTTKVGGTWNNQVGHGLLDMCSAISMAQSISYPNSGSVSLTGGQTTLNSGGSGYVGTTFTASPNNSSYKYYWSGSYTGTCDRWYVTPNTTNGPVGNVSVYLNSGQSGVLAVTCRVYSNTTFIGSSTQYVYVSY